MDAADLDYTREMRDKWLERAKELNDKARAMDDYPFSDESILRAVYARQGDMAAEAAQDLCFLYAHFSGEEFILMG